MLTPAARRVLTELAEDDQIDLVSEGIEVYCGTRRTNWKVLRQLLDCMAVSITFGSNTGMIKDKGPTYFGINGTGRAIVRRPELADEVWLHIIGRKGPFQVVDDKITKLDAFRVVTHPPHSTKLHS